MSLDVIKEFVFPSTLQHPRSTGLLYVYGLYGPLNEAGKLYAGRNGAHEVDRNELDTMVKIIEEEDILAVYVVSKSWVEVDLAINCHHTTFI